MQLRQGLTSWSTLDCKTIALEPFVERSDRWWVLWISQTHTCVSTATQNQARKFPRPRCNCTYRNDDTFLRWANLLLARKREGVPRDRVADAGWRCFQTSWSSINITDQAVCVNLMSLVSVSKPKTPYVVRPSWQSLQLLACPGSMKRGCISLSIRHSCSRITARVQLSESELADAI